MGNGSVNTDDVQVALPVPARSVLPGANTSPKKEHFFFLSFLFISQARSRGGGKGKKYVSCLLDQRQLF